MSENPYALALAEWRVIKEEFDAAEDPHETYLIKLREIRKLQEKCQKSVKNSLNHLAQLKASVKRIDKSQQASVENEDAKKMKEGICELESRLLEMKGELPVQNNGIYLSIILGSNLNLSLMNKDDRYRYKKEYEKFKVTVNCVLLGLLALAFVFTFRVIDSLISFVLVWFYCTLTIREAILRINASRIKGWWITHHYVSSILCGIMVTWKEGECYQSIRNQFVLFYFYLSVVQLLQSRYQTGCLRRLHALGQRHSMDITVEGFSSWMFKGLTFLIPFLVLTYIFQFQNAYALYVLSCDSRCSGQWQITALSIGFFFVGLCNSLTLLAVVINKWKNGKSSMTITALQTKYRLRAPLKSD